jgi:hypothetical protein
MDLTDIKSLPEDKLLEVIRELQDTLRERRGETTLSSLLNPLSDNFLGSGMTLQEFLLKGQVDVWRRSFVNQPRPERKRRLGLLIRLSAELLKVREQTSFGTGLAEAVLEDLIEGDWKMLREWAKHFSFEDEDEEIRAKYIPIYAKFVGLCKEGYEDQPGVEGLH